jgi:hypothetical protein
VVGAVELERLLTPVKRACDVPVGDLEESVG